MQTSIANQIRVWLPTQVIVVGEMGIDGRASDGKQSGTCPGLRPGHDDRRYRSRLVGQRGLGQRLFGDLTSSLARGLQSEGVPATRRVTGAMSNRELRLPFGGGAHSLRLAQSLLQRERLAVVL